MKWPVMVVMSLFLRGRVALGYWLSTNRRDSGLRGEIEYYAKRLKRIVFPWSRPMATVLEAGLATGERRQEAASCLLENASNEFEKSSLHGFSSAAAYLSALLCRDKSRIYSGTKSLEFFTSQNVRNPEAFLRMLLPGSWL
jgi:hypothetical protein